MLPYLKKLEGQVIQNFIRHFYRVQCKILKINIAKYLIALAFQTTLTNGTLNFNNEKILLLKTYINSEDVYIQIIQNEIQFKSIKAITFQPQEIIKIEINFCADTQIVHNYELNEETFLLISPQIHLDPILMAPSVCLYNTNKNMQILPENSTLFSISFNTDTVLNLPQDKKQVLSKHQFDKSIINYSFLQNMVNTISKVAFISLVKTPIYTLRGSKSSRKIPKSARHDSNSEQKKTERSRSN